MRDDNNNAGTDEKRKKCHHLQSSSWSKWICGLGITIDVLEVKKDCDKAANETIDMRIQFIEF